MRRHVPAPRNRKSAVLHPYAGARKAGAMKEVAWWIR